MYILLQQQKSISTDWDQPLSAVDWVRETERYINIIHRVSVHVKTTLLFFCICRFVTSYAYARDPT